MSMREESQELRHQIGVFLEALRKNPIGLTGNLLPTSLRNIELQLHELERNPFSDYEEEPPITVLKQ